ncbi:MAG: histidinol-phosphatase [Bacillati bacterium ANGP1]|uniref:Histidinol-phosphatase n=1 Tax=Candidatus Segetimicrobium genomatis TaxID=2569760 RepID=A0A537JKT0_9BACT|nr:MAG: histidinol-phosphatase [Terrabacteria group bacterium ANGP1]
MAAGTDYHMHLERGPWTLEWLERFVETARARGLREIGFSEHPHRFRECRAIYPTPLPWVDAQNTERLDSYLRLVEQARAAGLPVKLALEWDYLPGFEAALERAIGAHPWDYAIGSVHWLPPATRGGEWWGFDDPARISDWERVDVLEVYRRYFRLIGQAARTGLFDIIGHADVIKVMGYRPKADIADLYAAAALEFAAAVYPAPPFLRACRLAGVPVLINSDAHVPEDVGRDFDRAAAVARDAGYGETAAFAQRSRTMVPL